MGVSGERSKSPLTSRQSVQRFDVNQTLWADHIGKVDLPYYFRASAWLVSLVEPFAQHRKQEKSPRVVSMFARSVSQTTLCVVNLDSCRRWTLVPRYILPKVQLFRKCGLGSVQYVRFILVDDRRSAGVQFPQMGAV